MIICFITSHLWQTLAFKLAAAASLSKMYENVSIAPTSKLYRLVVYQVSLEAFVPFVLVAIVVIKNSIFYYSIIGASD